MLRRFISLVFFIPTVCFCQQKPDSLTIEKIMSDPKWIGTSPSNPFWSADGAKLFFDWNPEKALSDSLYYITIRNRIPEKASVEQKQSVVSANSVTYNLKRTAYVYQKDGDIYYKEIKSDKTHRVTQTEETEYNPQFSFGEKEIVYNHNQNLFSWDIKTGETKQLTNFINEENKKKEEKLSPEDQWLKKEQIQYMQVLRERKDKEHLAKVYDSIHAPKELRKINIGDKRIQNISISPGGRFISYTLYQSPGKRKSTIVPNYITESGYTTDITGRQKVGEPEGQYQFFIYDRQMDSVFEVKIDSIECIKDIPEFMKDYPTELAKRKKENALRNVYFASAKWSPKGTNLLLDIRAQDHKDRWLMLWDSATKKLKLLDRQYDSAWIGGPGMWNTGWINENEYWYQSEVTGFSHLYSVNVSTGKKKAYTSGKYEVLDAQL
ncbi:MAG TPA: DPP IV N-terminal domain-containing protein, partial [Hanamia sp.]|nr:DPP IV N-terminal domain-containing protein [Hanamia sp.]